MAQPYPLPREIRSTGTLAFDGASVTFGPFDFKIFDTADVVVELKHAGDAEWTATSAVTVTKSSAAALDTFSVTFDVIHPVTSTFRVRGARLHERSVGLAKGIGLDLVELEKEVSKQGVVLQETRADAGLRDADRARTLRAPDGESLPAIPPVADRGSRVLGFDATGRPIAMVPGTADAQAVANTYPRRSADNEQWDALTPAEVLTDLLSGNLPVVPWDNSTTFERGRIVSSGATLYYLPAAQSVGDDPADGAPWVEIIDVSDLPIGAIDNTPIGSTAPSTGKFTQTSTDELHLLEETSTRNSDTVFYSSTGDQIHRNTKAGMLASLGIGGGGGGPVGIIDVYAGPTPPAGWLACDGAAVSRATYADLFAVVGVTFGDGDGSTTFNVPDLRGEWIRGWDAGRGVDAGRVFGSWQADELGEHQHASAIDPSGNTLGAGYTTGTGPMSTSGYYLTSAPGNYAHQETSPVGGPETRPRNVALLYCIKAFDVVLDPSQLSAANVIADVASNAGRITDLEAAPFTKEPYDSGELAITAGGSLTLPHPLGVQPKLVTIQLVCNTAEHGFDVGDKFFIPSVGGGDGGSNSAPYGVNLVIEDGNTTEIYIRYGVGFGGGVFSVRHKTTGAAVVLTSANWRLRVWGYA